MSVLCVGCFRNNNNKNNDDKYKANNTDTHTHTHGQIMMMMIYLQTQPRGKQIVKKRKNEWKNAHSLGKSSSSTIDGQK